MRTSLLAAAGFVALAIVGAAPALAETAPRSVGADPRIKQYTYVKDTVYRLDVAMKIITSIEFAPGEAIDTILFSIKFAEDGLRVRDGHRVAADVRAQLRIEQTDAAGNVGH